MERGISLSLCMIVKDEEEWIARCLRSVQGIADEIIVVDTGSSDRTAEIAESMKAVVYCHRWERDFAKARNVSIGKARGEWILFLDADEELHAEDRDTIRSLLSDPTAAGFFLLIENRLDDRIERSLNLRLFRNHPQHYFIGSLHEQVAPSIYELNPQAEVKQTAVRVVHYGYSSEQMRRKRKEERNLELALAEVSRRPDSGFAHFCAAQSYMGSGTPLVTHLEQAVNHLQTAKAKAHPDAMWSRRVYKLLAIAQEGLGRKEAAYATLLEGMVRYPDYQDLYYLQGKMFEKDGKLHRAAGSYRQCLDIGKERHVVGLDQELDRGAVHFALGQLYEAQGSVRPAIEQYEHAAAAGPGRKEPLLRMGELLAKRESPERIRERFERLVPEELPDRSAFMQDVFVRLGHKDSALVYLERLLDTAPDREDALFAAGTIWMERGGYEEAADRLRRIPKESPFYREAMLMLAACCWFSGSPDQGARVLATNGDLSWYRALSDLFLREAAYLLEEGIKAHPQSQQLPEILGKLREVMDHGT